MHQSYKGLNFKTSRTLGLKNKIICKVRKNDCGRRTFKMTTMGNKNKGQKEECKQVFLFLVDYKKHIFFVKLNLERILQISNFIIYYGNNEFRCIGEAANGEGPPGAANTHRKAL